MGGNMNTNRISSCVGTLVLLGSSYAYASCGSAFCSINTNWDEHSPSHPGWTVSLSYSHSRADILRSGTDKISADTSIDGEVENLRTVNQVVNAHLDYTYDQHWGVMVYLPYISRDHNHNLGPYVGSMPAGYESFHANALGDIKVIGRYRWLLDEDSSTGVGVKFGLKLNTGKKDFVIAQTGEKPSEFTLQPGNGSTDLILGAFWNQSRPGSGWNWFAQATLQSSINSDAMFRPGNQINLDGGMRYALGHDTSALMQLNMQWNGTDSGDAAALTEDGAASSGGRTVSITPGLSYALAPDTQIFALVQLPVYQYVNGQQLTASSSATAGISHRF